MEELLNASARVETVNEPQTEEQQPVTAVSEAEQSGEENARYAAARRRAESEMREKYDRRQADYDRRFAKLAKDSGVDGVTGMEDYLKRVETMALDRRLQTGEMTGDEIRKMVDEMVRSNPLVEQARETVVRGQIAEDVKRISKIDPDIRTPDDLCASDKFDDVLKFMQEKGMDAYDAYRLVHFDRLMEKSGAAAKQAAINQAKGKDHMQPVGGTAEPSAEALADIPEKILSRWKAAFPGCTYEQLKRKYNDAKKE